MIRLACLDMAGTTVRDEGAVLAAFADALAATGLDPGTPENAHAIEYARRTMGRSKISVFRSIFETEDRARRANAVFEKAFAGRLKMAEPVEGAEETIRVLQAGGVKVTLTTGFSPGTRDALLTALGWNELADLALSPADAGRGRPYPDMPLTALIRLGIDDVREIAVAGDTSSDLLCGARAGASVVAGVLTGAHGRSEFAGVPHTHVLDSIADLPEEIL